MVSAFLVSIRVLSKSKRIAEILARAVRLRWFCSMMLVVFFDDKLEAENGGRMGVDDDDDDRKSRLGRFCWIMMGDKLKLKWWKNRKSGRRRRKQELDDETTAMMNLFILKI